MFRMVVALLLGLTGGCKVALSLTNNWDERDGIKPALVEFLVRQHFAAFELNDIKGVEAIADDCRLRLIEAQVWKQNIIKDFVSADDRFFFVYRRTVYTNLRRKVPRGRDDEEHVGRKGSALDT